MPQRKALLIGINYYGTDAELGGCINDIDNIKEYLISEQNFGASRVIQLREDDASRSRHPTRHNILRYFDWLINGAKPGDHLYVHYSGHGSRYTDASGDETDGHDECIIPLDYATGGVISDDELNSLLAYRLPRGVVLTVLLDCCHSGSGLDMRFRYNSAFEVAENTKYSLCRGLIKMISGCRDVQVSMDAWNTSEQEYQGAMTRTFLEVMRAGGNELSCSELIKEMNELLESRGFDQKPMLSSNRKLSGMEEFLI